MSTINYNDGKPHSLKNVPVEEKMKMIHDFAEGNAILEKFLLTCSDYQVETHSCCAGHEKGNATPYVSMLYDDNSKYYLSQIYNFYQNNQDIFKSNTKIVFSSSDSGLCFGLYFLNRDYVNNLELLSNIKLNKDEPINKELICVARINEFVESMNLSVSYQVYDGVKNISFYEKGTILLPSDDVKNVYSLSLSMLTNGNFMTGYYDVLDTEALEVLCSTFDKVFKNRSK